MKGVILKAPAALEQLALTDLPDPGLPGPGEVRVRIHASSLNYHDLAVVTGMLPTLPGRIPLSDGAGVVEAIGAGVERFGVGDHVVSTFFPNWHAGDPVTDDFSATPGDGVDGYAREIVVAGETAFTHAPMGYSHAEAATLTTAGVTAWRALVVNGAVKAGDSVLVLGTGGVSIFALQIAKALEATVIVTSSSEAKLERATQLGADHTINYRQTPEWGARVRELTGGRGVDHVVEVCGAGTLAQSIAAVRLAGHIALIGVLDGFAGMVPTAALIARQIRLQGFVAGHRGHQAELVEWLQTSGIRPVIERRFGLEAIADAFRLQAAAGHFGKIALEF